MSVTFSRTIPVLRSFDATKAREFYVDFLGFSVDWEHRFEKDLPLYMQISRGELVLHLSEHHGDCTPGSTVFVDLTGIEEFHRELLAKQYKNLRPRLRDTDWNTRTMEVMDPFGNRLRFSESLAARPQEDGHEVIGSHS